MPVNVSKERNYDRNYEPAGDVRARAIIGCKISASKLFYKKEVRTSDHNFPSSTKFHPKSGVKLWTTIEAPIEEYKEAKWPRQLQTGNLTCDLIEAEDGTLIAMSPAVVELMCGGKRKTKLTKFDDEYTIDDAREYLMERLVPLDLWDKNTFGLWVVLGS